MKFGLPISIIFHALAALGGLLFWSSKIEPLANVRIIPLELVTVSDMTNIAPRRTDDVKIPTEVEEDAKPDISEPPNDPVDKPEPEENQPEPAPVFDLDDLEKAFADVRKTNPDAQDQQVLGNEAQNLERADKAKRAEGAGTDSTIAAVDYIRARLKDCWFVDTGALDFQDLVINVELLLNEDGSIRNISVLNNADIISSSNRSWRAARHNALTGLRKCAPYDGLLAINYDIWKELRLRLDPGENE
ncbi:MAG: hypothetical protein COA91_03200 [Robiginitomaculum sp.]|nr:MAG: hypothetical protein COA91_03200 [Robiginitomaculum sp.]